MFLYVIQKARYRGFGALFTHSKPKLVKTAFLCACKQSLRQPAIVTHVRLLLRRCSVDLKMDMLASILTFPVCTKSLTSSCF